MRFTIHAPDGETYTTPEDARPRIEEGTGALHIIQSGGDRTIAVFPAGQWTRYIPAEDDTQDERGIGPVPVVWSVIEDESKHIDNGLHFIVGDEASLRRAYLNAAKHNKSGIR